MESELVTGSDSKGRNGGDRSALPTSYSEFFEEMCPYYINAGMTYEQYWDGDSSMVRAYKKAHDMKLEEANFELWLQGRYFYDALCFVSPILRAFSKARKPVEYLGQPYLLKTKYSEYREEQRRRASDKKAKAAMEAFAAKFNEQFKQKKGG